MRDSIYFQFNTQPMVTAIGMAVEKISLYERYIFHVQESIRPASHNLLQSFSNETICFFLDTSFKLKHLKLRGHHFSALPD